MHQILRGLALICWLALLLPVTQAKMPQDPDLTTELDAMFAALGGRQAVETVTSLRVEAICTGPGGPFITQVTSAPNDGVYFRQSASNEQTEIWSTPELTWTMMPEGGMQSLPPSVRAFVRSHEFHLLLLELTDRFTELRLGDPTELQSQKVHTVEMLDRDARPAKLWLHAESRLPLGLELNPEGAAGAVTVWFADWADFEGVRLFQSFRLTEGAEREFTYRYVSIQPNFAAAAPLAPPTDRSADRLAIGRILEADRQAHLQLDANLISEHVADQFVEISDGAVSTQTRQEIQTFFSRSFAGATFHAWEDLSPPLVRVSTDGQMAWVARTIRADREDLRDGNKARSVYTSAYTATYEKSGGRWWMTSVTSTFLPQPEKS